MCVLKRLWMTADEPQLLHECMCVSSSSASSFGEGFFIRPRDDNPYAW